MPHREMRHLFFSKNFGVYFVLFILIRTFASQIKGRYKWLHIMN